MMASTVSTDRTEKKDPTFYIPTEFYELHSPGAVISSWIFKCKKCAGVKLVASSYRSRYNLRSHIKSKHVHAVKRFDAVCAANDQRKNVSNNAASATSPSKTLATPDEATSSHQTTLPSMFEKKMTQSGFDDLISVYLSRCALPFNHVESSGFKEFVTKLAPGYRIKTHHAYALRCRRITTLLKQKLVQSFTKASKVR